ncbi:MAG: hypothetical protein DSY43_02845 [Gammaproteobacteria bacterium]|nr:MAG: hypothetical protein DSY43_02845 [Gammaproteobacteria bacterium]
MKFILLLLLVSINTEAGLLNFSDIKQASQAYKNENYQVAAEKFGKIDNDAARLNQANSLYKQGLYEQALEKYTNIKQQDLDFERLYNSANTYVKLKKMDEAIELYQQALKIRQDKDALFNLNLLKKKKTKRKKNEKGKDKKSKNQKKDTAKKKQQQSGKKKGDKKQEKNKQQQQRKKLDKLEQQRWEKSLNKQLRTLLIPLNNKQKNNENDNKKNLW